jgi:hypothetical protein
LTPTLTEKQEEQIIKLDQLRSFKNPFTKEMVAARILSEKKYLPCGLVYSHAGSFSLLSFS